MRGVARNMLGGGWGARTGGPRGARCSGTRTLRDETPIWPISTLDVHSLASRALLADCRQPPALEVQRLRANLLRVLLIDAEGVLELPHLTLSPSHTRTGTE